jgi:hypothetical protein
MRWTMNRRQFIQEAAGLAGVTGALVATSIPQIQAVPVTTSLQANAFSPQRRGRRNGSRGTSGRWRRLTRGRRRQPRSSRRPMAQSPRRPCGLHARTTARYGPNVFFAEYPAVYLQTDRHTT